MTRDDYIRVFREEPARVARMVGFPDIGRLHNDWMRDMLYGKDDMTLLAHRLSYKTSCVAVVLAMYIGTMPRISSLFMRKTDTDVKEIVRQVKKILVNNYFCYALQQIMGAPFELIRSTDTEIDSSYNDSPRGTSQLFAIGTGSSITGKHYDRIFTDDIVNLEDRKSRAERENTKLVYQELINVKAKNGRIINTGTPWHPQDAISELMKNVQRYDCYKTGIMTPESIEEKRHSMSPSLFAANYELKHIASENALFTTSPRFITPQIAREALGDSATPESLFRDGTAHIDAAYGGDDYTAFTCARRIGGNLYLYGKIWQRHVDTVLDFCISECQRLMVAPILCEDNGDKGFLAKEIIRKGYKASTYHEHENKFLKISSFLRKWWDNIYFLEGTDRAYIDQIMNYTEDAEHDDAPDSASVLCRYYDRKSGVPYQSPLFRR